ncbi:metalloprotease [Jannaschia ovalis]|uniref:Site-2 protease family protein n=1 Tax=Jannaschia ovalis TaxID=3038773 RepID=A0ABY8LEZ4_9RHOB|nr:site-2 protease family protein [Jannaschia sp. GRR-S6-38]WGH79868.1 site-2 protease family protein [Jannaschia sp. GRR-S6-38]
MITRDEPPLFEIPGPMGVPIQIAPSFLILAVILTGFHITPHSLAFVAMIALAILLHELGHAWGGYAVGNGARRVVLWGGGGFCEYDRASPPLAREFEVAMGPLTNLALWALSSLVASWLVDGYFATGIDALWYAGWYAGVFAKINLVLFALNLIPVQPLDGGKLLHLALMRRARPRNAARIAGAIGLFFALLWVPMMIAAYLTWGWLLLFLPSIPDHWRLARGAGVGVRP